MNAKTFGKVVTRLVRAFCSPVSNWLTDVTRYTVARHKCRAEIWLTPIFRVYPKNGAGGASLRLAHANRRFAPQLAAHFANLLDGFLSVQCLSNGSKISVFRFLRRNRDIYIAPLVLAA